MRVFKNPKNQRGMTLIEIMAVVAIIGIIIAIVALAMRDSADNARAKLNLRVATNIVSTIKQVANSCGTSTSATASPVPASGRSMLDVVFMGQTAVLPSYQACYGTAGVRPPRESVTKNGSSWQVGTQPVSITGGAGQVYAVQFQLVQEETALAMAKTYDASLQALAASDNTSDILQYSSATNGTRTVTVLLN